MANTRTYTDEEIAHALAVLRSNRGNAKKTALQLGVSRTTLRGWAGRMTSATARPKQVSPEKSDKAREGLAEKFGSAAERFVEAALSDPSKVEKASVRDLLVAAGIATEKSELLRGGATSRVESVRVQLADPDSLRSSSLRVLEGGKKTALPRETGETHLLSEQAGRSTRANLGAQHTRNARRRTQGDGGTRGAKCPRGRHPLPGAG